MTGDASRTGQGPDSPPPHWRPDWLKKPTGEDLAWAYPERASRMGVGGRARMECQVAVDGRLAKCRVTEESPQGMEFGKAALALAPQFQMTPPPPGRTEPGEVTIPIIFTVPVSDAPRATVDLTAPLGVALQQGRTWLIEQAKAPSPSLMLFVAIAVLALVGGPLVRRARRRYSDKDLTGPNSERR